MNRLAFSKKLTRVNKILFNWTAVLVVAFNGLAAATPLFISGTAHAVPGNSGNTPTSLYFKQDGNTYQCGDTTNSSDAATLYWTAPTGVGTHDGGYKLEVNEPGYGGIYDSYPDKNDVSALALKFADKGVGEYDYTLTALKSNNHESGHADCALTYQSLTNPSSPTLTSPSNSAFLNSGNVTFEWEAATAGTYPVSSYMVQWSQDPNFNSGVSDSTTSNLNYSPSGALVDGTWYWRVEAADAKGNLSGWSNVFSFTIDSTSPSVSVTPVAGSLLHGTEAFDITINDVNPTSSKNKSVWVYLYNTSSPYKSSGQNVDLSSGSGTFTVDTTKLNDGNADLDVGIVYDAAGNPSGKADNYFDNYSIDNSAPTGLSNSTPADGTYTTTANLQQITWTAASDPESPVVYYYENSNSNSVNGDGSFSSPVYQSGALSTTYINTPNTPEGTYYWHVKACDTLSNCTGWTNPWEVTVDNTKPTVTLNSPSNGSYNPTSISLTGQDNDSLSLVTANIYDASDTTLIHSCSHSVTPRGTISYDLTCTIPSLPDGAYTIRYNAKDSAGNISTTKTSQFIIDTTAPVVTVTPAAGSLLHGTEAFNITVSDNNPLDSSKNTSDWVYLYNTNGNWAEQYGQKVDLSSGSGTFTVNTANLPDGTYDLDVGIVYDAAGNPSGKADNYFDNYTIDNTAPTLAINSPSDSALLSYVTNGSIDVTGSLTDTNPSSYSILITGPNSYSAGTGAVSDASNFSGQSLYSWDLNGLASGTYTIELTGTDAANNSSSTSIQVSVDNTAPSVPTAVFTASNTGNPVANGGVTNSLDFTFGLSNPMSDGVVRYQLKYWNDISGSAFDGEANAWNPTDLSAAGHMSILGEYTDNFTQGEGTHYFAFSACDAAGNCSAYSSPFVVSYDATAPSQPGDPSTTSPTNNDAVSWTWTAANDNLGPENSGIDHYVYWLTDSSSNVVVSPTDTSSLNTDTQVTSDGTYTLHVEAADGAGNIGSESDGSVTVDTTPPVTTVNSLSTTNTTPTLTGTVNETVNSLTVTVDGQTYTATVNGNSWSAKVTYTLAPGTYDVATSATDSAGNTGTGIAAKALTIQSITNSVVHHNFAPANNNGNNGGNGNTGGTGQVLGANTNTPSNNSNGDNNGHVLGASTNTPSGKNITLSNNKVKNSNKFLGLGWWWLLILAALAGFMLWLLGRRRNKEDQ